MSTTSRMPTFVGGPADPAAILADKHVAAIGAGSVGQVAIDHFARSGIGALSIVDRSSFKSASVHTHPIDPEVIGQSKAESTAQTALDPVTELKVMEAIRQRGTTCIVIAHRLSAIRDCDEIVVLDQGRVAERGRHEDLLASDGLYARLIEA